MKKYTGRLDGHTSFKHTIDFRSDCYQLPGTKYQVYRSDNSVLTLDMWTDLHPLLARGEGHLVNALVYRAGVSDSKLTEYQRRAAIIGQVINGVAITGAEAEAIRTEGTTI